MYEHSVASSVSGSVGIHLASLVLGDLVLGVLVALLGLAVRPAGFGNVDLEAKCISVGERGLSVSNVCI
jgi:hypothetical protein